MSDQEFEAQLDAEFASLLGRHHRPSTEELLLGEIFRTARRTEQKVDKTMADLTALKAAVGTLTETVDAVKTFVETNDNQADVDSVTATIADANTALAALVPTPTPEPEPAPSV